MLIQLGVNESLAKCHSLARRIPGSVVAWNGSSYEVVADDEISNNISNNNKFQTKLWTAFIAAGASLYGLNARTTWSSGDLGMSILCGFISMETALVAATLPAFRENASDCAAFLNGLLGIATRRRREAAFRETVGAATTVALLIRMIIAIQVVYPWAFSLVALAWPCSPLNMFSSLIGWCGEGVGGEGTYSSCSNNIGWQAKVATAVGTASLHVALWKAFFSGAVVDTMHIFLGSLSQESLLQFMRNRPDDSQTFPSQQLRLYRSVQLLNTSFNNYCSPITMAVVSGIIAAEISITYLVLKILGGGSSLPFPINLMMTAACPIMYLLHVMTVNQAAGVNTLSMSVLAKLRMRVMVESGGGGSGRGQSTKLTRRQARSAWPLKVKLGENNFIEAITTLVLLDFTLRRLQDLLLIGIGG